MGTGQCDCAIGDLHSLLANSEHTNEPFNPFARIVDFFPDNSNSNYSEQLDCSLPTLIEHS